MAKLNAFSRLLDPSVDMLTSSQLSITPTTNSSNENLSTDTLIGIIIGCIVTGLVIAALVVLIAVFQCRRNKQRRQTETRKLSPSSSGNRQTCLTNPDKCQNVGITFEPLVSAVRLPINIRGDVPKDSTYLRNSQQFPSTHPDRPSSDISHSDLLNCASVICHPKLNGVAGIGKPLVSTAAGICHPATLDNQAGIPHPDSIVKTADGTPWIEVTRRESPKLVLHDESVRPKTKGFDNFSFAMDDEISPSTSSAHFTLSQSIASLNSPGFGSPDTNVRRSYRLDNSTASAIAAQRNRETSVLCMDIDLTESDIVIVYKERTAL